MNQTQTVPKMQLDLRGNLVVSKGASFPHGKLSGSSKALMGHTQNIPDIPGWMDNSSDRCYSPAVRVKSKPLPTARKFPCDLPPPDFPGLISPKLPFLSLLSSHTQPPYRSSNSPSLFPLQDLCTYCPLP